MINFFFLFIAIFFSFNILIQKNSNRIIWFTIGLLFFPHSIAFSLEPYITFPRILIYSLLISFLIFEKRPFSLLKESPFGKSLTIVFILLLFVGLCDERLNLFLKIFRPITYYVENFFLLFIIYESIKTKEDYNKIIKVLLFSFFIMCIYGITNYITKSNPYNNIISNTYGTTNFAESYMDPSSYRFRINSFTWHPIYYGFILAIAIAITIIIIFYFSQKRKKIFFLILLPLLIINLLLVNTRTPIAVLFVIIVVFFLLGLEFKRKLQFALLGVLVVIPSIMLYPNSTKIVNDTIDIFQNGGEGLKGSSVEMRYLQLAISYTIFNQKPVTGHGFNYITEGLGYSSNKLERTSNKNLFGFESYLFLLLIEQGILGIIANLVFFGALLAFFIKYTRSKIKTIKKMSILSISLLLGHIIFIVGTGSLLTFPFMMIIYGSQAKYIIISENDN